uniref:NADH-ubiquinone oxidoreductase chain 6 n=1 Tax=Glaucocystis nostochinearum TaxID=38271 RepID=E9P6D2_9EUKA|nr:NADH dehydrogenase subunit 6 [Glaucocystis nostochinearum]ADW83116.1 NADH dehydrogenase subunit 6 [Glaucocystis nostochinearum]
MLSLPRLFIHDEKIINNLKFDGYSLDFLSIEYTFFILFSFLALFSSIIAITSKNPIHSVFYLILVFFNVTGLLILLNAEFLAMLILVVYLGAIAVLFLFVVMMLNIKYITLKQITYKNFFFEFFIFLLLFLEVFLLTENNVLPNIINFFDMKFLTNIEKYLDVINNLYFKYYKTSLDLGSFDNSLYTNAHLFGVIYISYLYYFFMAGFILLIAMIGAIVLTLHRRPNVRKQQIIDQITRDFKAAVVLRK